MEEHKFVAYLVQEVFEIEKYHKTKQMYYKEELRERAYGWHNPYAPPEYRRSILLKEKMETELVWDLYVLMIKCYEMIQGEVPAENFQLNRKWKIWLREKMKDWDEEVQNCIVKLIGICTLSDPEKRPNNLDTLIKSQEFIFLCDYAKRHISQEDICQISL